MIEYAACGRRLTNDVKAPNAAAWSFTAPRQPYCADSEDCMRDVYGAGLDEIARRRHRP